MKKHLLLFKTLIIACIAIVTGGSISVAQNANYTLDTTGDLRGTNNVYAQNCDVTWDKITWNITGNTTLNPWRIGGSSLKNTNREVYTKTAYSSEVSSIKLTVGTASSITVHSLKLLVSQNAAFTDSTEILAKFAANSTIEFKPKTGNFHENSYYKFVFKVSVSGDNNKFIEFKKVEFFNAPSNKTTTTTTFGNDVNNKTFKVLVGQESSFTAPTATFSPNNATGTLTYSSNNTAAIGVDSNSGDLNFKAIGKATITATFSGDENYSASSASYTIDYTDGRIVISNDNSSFDNVGSYKDKYTNYSFPANDGNSYTFNCIHIMTGNGKNLQMNASSGVAKSPSFDFEFGYKVNVTYFISNNSTPLTIKSGSLSASGVKTVTSGETTIGTGYMATLENIPAGSSFTIKAGGNATYVSKIEIIPYTSNYIANPYKEYTSFKEIKIKAASGDKVRITLNNAKVVYAYTNSDSQIEAYVRNSDDTGDAICFYNTGLNIKQNDILNGTLKATYTIFNGMPELTSCPNTEAITVTPCEEAALPKEITLNDLTDNSCDLITVKGVLADVSTISEKTITTIMADGSNNAPQVYDKFTNYEIFNNATIDLTGIIIPFEKGATTIATSFEIAPTNKYDIVYRFSENDITTPVGAVTDAKVAIERTLSSDYWNTLCLPFSLSADQITATFGEGTIITEFEDVNAEGTVMTFKKATSIEAGKPYLFKPANTVPNPVFEGVAITSADADLVPSKNGNYAFVGTYDKYNMKTDKSEVFITTSGKLSYPAAGTNTIKGMRAYIMLPKTNNAKAFNLNIGGEATSIDTIDGGLFNGNATIYNLNGQKMSSDINGLAKGLYIVNGKKMIVK